MNSVQYAATLVNPEYKHVLEFGVFEGYTLGLIREALDDSYKVFGFDSFEGLPEDWENTVCMKGHFNTNGKIPDIQGVKFFKGWFEDTIPDYLKECDDIALLHVDCDLYSSTKTIFKYLHPFIKKDTIIVFDEWRFNEGKNNDHEQKAFYEYVIEHNVMFTFIDFYDQQNPSDRRIIKIL